MVGQCWAEVQWGEESELQFTVEPSYGFCKSVWQIRYHAKECSWGLDTYHSGWNQSGSGNKGTWKTCSSEADVNLCSVRCEDLTFASKTLEERNPAILCIPLWACRTKLENRPLGYLGEESSSMLNKDVYRFYHVSCMADRDATRSSVCPARKAGISLLVAININSRWNAVIPQILRGHKFLVSVLIWEGKQSVNIIWNKNNILSVAKTLLVVCSLFVVSGSASIISAQLALIMLWICQRGKPVYSICLHRFKTLLVKKVVQQTSRSRLKAATMSFS